MRIIVAGDFCDHGRTSTFIEKKEYSRLFDNIKSQINGADYSIVNFEFPIVKGKKEPISKNGPNLEGHPNSAEAIAYAGFKCCTLANNHILDQGVCCAMQTKEVLESQGIDTVGFGRDSVCASQVLYKNINGEKLAIINCCEHEFSIATRNSAGANGLNPIQQYYFIKEAKKKADYVLVIVHGGIEHFQLPSPRMKELYRFFVDSGADAVVNHHQHCYSGYEVYNGKPIFYGLGNFLFDWNGRRHSLWNEGFMVNFLFERHQISFRMHPYTQCDDENAVIMMDENKEKLFYNMINALNKVIADDEMLVKEVYRYYENNKKGVLSVLNPYMGKIPLKLFFKGLLPNIIKGKRLTKILNYIYCESHRDILIYNLNKLNSNEYFECSE